MKRLAALALLLVAVVPSATGASSARTLVTSNSPIGGFVQNERYIAWVAMDPKAKCGTVFLQDLRSGRRRRLTASCAVGDAPGPNGLMIAGNAALWEEGGASNLTEYSELMRTRTSSPYPIVVGFQSIAQSTFDKLVPAVGDGRGVYFWTSPDDATPGPVYRYGRRGTGRKMTRRIPRLAAVGAGEGRWAFAKAHWTFDCAREPTWYPSGRLAFASGVARACRGGIWVVNTNGDGLRRLASSGRNPDWSRSGQLAFDDAGAVKVLDGTEPPRVLIPHGTDPVWSPDGTRIAFVRGDAIVVAAADGSEQRVVVSGATAPDWSPDGARLVHARTAADRRGLGVVRVDGSESRSLTTDVDTQPAWSPDGARIAFTHCSNAHAACPDDVTQIREIAPDGSGMRTATADGDETYDSSPTWGPKSQLVFVRSRDWQDEGDSHIFTRSRRITRTPRPGTSVLVRSAAGRSLGRFEPNGEVVRLAVSRQLVAAIVKVGGRWRLELLAPHRRSVSLGPGRRLPTVSAAGPRIVLLFGSRSIMVYDIRSGLLRRVATASSTPIGLSIVGRRIAWAETVGERARIRVVMG